MNCPKCGMQNMDGITFCGNCGAQMTYQAPPQSSQASPYQNYYGTPNSQQSSQPYQQSYASPEGGMYSGGMIPPKNYMTESIIVTIVSFLCCCSPISIILGIIAIVKANNVNPEFERGNVNEAISEADTAKKLTIWAAVIAVAFSIIITIIYFAFMAAVIQDAGGFENFFR
ncbi:MAG: CD225/dispanin family protein [Dysgonamonadaceae bacterium]|nr:CD225/dispanin family protein [Dysgonamonadaceae bacterium]